MVIWAIFPIPHESCSNDRTDVDFIVELQPFGITWITNHQYSNQQILYASWFHSLESKPNKLVIILTLLKGEFHLPARVWPPRTTWLVHRLRNRRIGSADEGIWTWCLCHQKHGLKTNVYRCFLVDGIITSFSAGKKTGEEPPLFDRLWSQLFAKAFL